MSFNTPLLSRLSIVVMVITMASSCYEPETPALEEIQGFVEQSCVDGIMTGGETGVDCGGPCPPCASCSDGVLNQGETLIDCGGPCPPCEPE